MDDIGWYNNETGQWDKKSPDLPAFLNSLVNSRYHAHKIVEWAVQESCYFCGYPASHKVEEETFEPVHPLTAYVCCNHFWGGCRNGTS